MFFLLMIMLAANSSSSALANTKYKHAEDGYPSTLDPVHSAATYGNTIITAVYDTLYEYRYLKRPFELKPNLAESMPELLDGGRTLRIKLKKNVTFSDDPCFSNGKGRQVVAEDFVYSVKRHFKSSNMSQGKWLWQGLLGIEKWLHDGAREDQPILGLKSIDSHTLEIRLVAPIPQFINFLAMGFSAVVPREAVEKYGKDLGHHPVGSGPWLVSEFNEKRIVLTKNPRYRDEIFSLKDHGFDSETHKNLGLESLEGKKLPIVDSIEYNFIKHDSARWQAFLKGNEVHATWVPALHLAEVAANKNPLQIKPEFSMKFKSRQMRELGMVFFEFNMANPQIGYNTDSTRNKRNKALRCAIRKGFDWHARIERMHGGFGEAFAGIIPPDAEGFNPHFSKDSVHLDILGAVKLLKDNEWNSSNLPELRYSGVASPQTTQLFELFRGWLKRLGYPLQKIKVDTFATFGAYNEAIRQGMLMTHDRSWSMDYPLVENMFQLFYSRNAAPGSNTSNYNNPDYDKLYEQIAAFPSSVSQRQALYDKANQTLIDDCVVISGFSRTRIFAWDKKVIMYPERNVLGNYFKYISF